MTDIMRIGSIALLSVIFVVPSTVRAGNTWDGGGANSLWQTPANWTGDTLPSYGSLTFDGSGSGAKLSNYNDYASLAMNGIIFNNATLSYNLFGNNINFYDNGGVQAKIENQGTATQYISLPITFAATAGTPRGEINPLNGNLIISNTVAMSGSAVNAIHVYGSNQKIVEFHGVISGSGKAFMLKQDSRVLFNAANTYTGNTEIDAGQLRIGPNGDISGSSSIYLGNGTTPGTAAKFFLNSDANGKTFSRVINVNPGDGTSGNREIGFLSTSTSDVGTFSGNIVRSGSGRVLSLFSAGGRVIFVGDINGSDGVILPNAPNGLVEYQGTKSYTGDTSIRRGELRIATGSGPSGGTIYVGEGGTFIADTATLSLGGVGSSGGLTLARPVQVNPLSSPAQRVLAGNNTSGVNTFSGNITLESFAHLQAAAGGRVDFTGVISQSSGTYGITKIGSGTVRLTGNNTYAGQTSIDVGTLQLGNDNRISDSSALYIASGATFDLNNFTEEVGNFVTSGGNVINLASGKQFRVNQTSDSIYSGTISGSGDFVKKGTAALRFDGAQNYTGQTSIDAGTLRLGANDRLHDSSTMFIASGATFDVNGYNEEIGRLVDTSAGNISLGAGQLAVNQDSDATYSGVISGTGGSFIKKGSATLTLSGANTYTGLTSIQNGMLRLGAAERLSDSSSMYIASGAVFNLNNFNEEIANLEHLSAGNVTLGSAQFRVNQTTAATYSGVISGTGEFVKKGSALLALSGANTYSGQTYIDGGELRYNVNQGGGYTGIINLGSTTGSAGATLSVGSGGVTLGNAITVRSGSTGNKFIVGAHTTGAATLSGAVTMNTLLTVQANAGGSLTLAGNITTGGHNLTNSTTGFLNLNGVISGTGRLIKQGTGTLTLGGINTYTGNTEIDEGTLAVVGDIANGSTTYIGNGGAGFASANATLALAANGVDLGGPIQVNTSAGTGSRTIASTAASGNTTISGNITVNRDVTIQANSGSALIISGNINANSHLITVSGANDVTISGNISGSGAQLTKTGTGHLILSGINTYSGATTLNGGTITITPGDSVTSATTINSGTMVVNGTAGNVTINSGGFLKGTGTVSTLVVNNGGSFSPGNSPGTIYASSTTWNPGGSYIWELNDVDAGAGTDPGWDLIDITGTLNISNNFTIHVTSLTLANVSGNVHDFNSSSNYTWVVAQTTGGVLNYTSGDILLNLSGFTNPYSGSWSVSADAYNVYVHYNAPVTPTVIPEPSMAVLMITGGLVLYARRRRARRARS